MTKNEDTVTLTGILTKDEASAFAQFLKRLSFADFRNNAVDEKEAYTMRDASDVIRSALAESGIVAL